MHETSNRLRLHTVDSAKSIPWPASSAAHSNTSMAACFAPRARSVFRRSLGATHSVGCGSVLVVTESPIVLEPLLADLGILLGAWGTCPN